MNYDDKNRDINNNNYNNNYSNYNVNDYNFENEYKKYKKEKDLLEKNNNNNLEKYSNINYPTYSTLTNNDSIRNSPQKEFAHRPYTPTDRKNYYLNSYLNKDNIQNNNYDNYNYINNYKSKVKKLFN